MNSGGKMRGTLSVAGTVTALALVFAASAEAQQRAPWPEIDKLGQLCAKAIDDQTGCMSCGGLWPKWAQCVAMNLWGNGPAVQRQFNECYRRVSAARAASRACAACGDPTDDVIACMMGVHR
jgi:hypothetical protein